MWSLRSLTLGRGRRGSVKTVRFMNNRTLLMYGVAGEKRPIFSESDAFLYNLGDPTSGRVAHIGSLRSHGDTLVGKGSLLFSGILCSGLSHK